MDTQIKDKHCLNKSYCVCHMACVKRCFGVRVGSLFILDANAVVPDTSMKQLHCLVKEYLIVLLFESLYCFQNTVEVMLCEFIF